jgi:hypothetical protein
MRAAPGWDMPVAQGGRAAAGHARASGTIFRAPVSLPNLLNWVIQNPA